MKTVYYRTRKVYTDIDREGWKYYDILLPSNLKITNDLIQTYHSGILSTKEKNETVIDILFEQEEQYEITKF